jgi:hypothetical protein
MCQEMSNQMSSKATDDDMLHARIAQCNRADMVKTQKACIAEWLRRLGIIMLCVNNAGRTLSHPKLLMNITPKTAVL